MANSTPIVVLDSKLNSFLVNLESKLDFPTPLSPNWIKKLNYINDNLKKIIIALNNEHK